ncbi:hypothetical protein EFN72_07140 [Leuconostoc citreum]|uniref:phage tail spike protein n=1 Tax=Leuconostoc citreum TaxID=33964 RepID=UPI0021A71190|nr:phage tail spike protein [Leuconostoc citreum]MCT3059035.1 hypothetical protein [Leuconostoc citreum]
MIYIFDKKQAIIKVLTNDDFTAAHLNFKINTATTFEFSLPASKALPSGSKYVATPHPLNDSKFIMLRLTERVDKTETIDYSAYELAYQELATDGYIEDKRPQNQSALNLMKIALDGSNWELNNVNVSGTATTNFYYVDRLSAISKVVDLLGGEIVFYIEIQGNAISGRYMDYLARQGSDTSKVFASGSNLLTVERQSDTSNIYTAILPRGKGKEIDNGEVDTPDGYGRRINIADVEWKKSAGKPLDKPKGSIVLSDPDATAEWGQINGNARLLLQTYDDIDDVNVLISSAYKTLQSVNHPQIQYSATVADVGGLSLGDTVLIMHSDRDLSYKTRVFEVKYDLLAPDQTELSLGDDLSSNSITSQINSLNAVADTTSSQTQWTISQIGRPGTTYGATAPDSPKVGDIWFKYLADGGTEIYRWNGDIWELLASPTTADDIAASVDDAVTQAKDYSDKAIADNQVKIDESIKSVDDKANQLKQDQSGLDAKAQGYANQALNDAKTNTSAAVQQTAKNATDALAQAKADLTSGIAKEATDRQNAVNALDKTAQGYANQAKSDAISAATKADGVINKKIDDTASGITATISQNKKDAEGKISTAQTTAQTAVDGLKTKVSQTDYDKKTGQLQTDLTSTTQTATQAKTDIVSIKQKDGDQDSRMNSIESDAKGTKQTISDIQTTQGKQSGSISTLQQRADGFDATVTKVDNLSVGGRNLLIGTATDTAWTADSTSNYSFNVIATGLKPNQTYTFSAEVTLGNTEQKLITVSLYDAPIGQWLASTGNFKADGTRDHWTFTVPSNVDSPTASLIIYAGTAGSTGGKSVTCHHGKLETGTIPTDWTPAPEDVDAHFSTQQQKIDSITSIVSDPNTGLTTRVQTAEGFMTSATDRLGKVENKSTSTADGLTREIKDRTDGDNNSLQQGKDFTTSQISNSETGMKSFVNQTISGLQIGAISSDVNALKLSTQWQTVNVDDLNNMTNQGKFFIQGGNHTNAPVGGWFYLTVDKPINGRITQVAWADSNPTMQYTRILFGSNWSNWNRVVTNETVLSIFNDSWSLGTSANDGITKQLITGINGQADGNLVVKGASIILDGAVKATADFYAKGGNFTNLNASNITVGTLNGNTVNITNINASNIVTGAISGANLNINLNTGQVVFQKGRIYNEGVQTSGAGIDVNIDQRYIATSDGYSSSVLKNGMMMLYQSTLVNSGKDPYFQIDNFGTQLTLEGARLRGSKNISLGVYSSSDVPVFGGHSELNGAVFSDGYAARIEGKDKGVKVSGGAAFGSISPASPNILVGVDWLRSGFGGDRIAVNAKYFYLLNQYATTTSSGANMFLTDDGAVIRSSSSSKYKLNINYEQSSETANKLLTIDPALWHDKFESEQLDKFHDIGIEPERTIDMDKRWYYGIIAEDLVKAGLEHLVMRDTKTGEVEGVEYSKIGVALIPIIRELRNRLNEQYVEIERLKEQSK